ncbi:MAG TPA: STAS/SEC14 domain-containing protein [Candidatus Saccharimonadales bacterium]|nr:STAS/SEC14 domain-containing protein [Candidatus Saccharimonadales bacterium]
MLQNKVILNEDGIIEIVTSGPQTATSIELMGREVDALITSQRATGKPALILDNLLGLGAVGADGRNLVVELAKRLDYDRAAMLGKGLIMRFGTNLMLRAVGQSYRVRYFEDRDAATAWLLEKIKKS